MLAFTYADSRACLLTAAAGMGAESADVNLDYAAQRALERAREPFHSPRADLPRVLRQDNLDYDKYREIRFRRDHALWTSENLPFRVEFFHPGYLYQEPVHVHEFTPTHTQPIRFVQDFFDYGNLHIANQIPVNTGYAGFRVLYPLNKPGQLDERALLQSGVISWLLASNLRYGESAHEAFLLDSGEGDNRPEEFLSHLHRLVAGQALRGSGASNSTWGLAIPDRARCLVRL